MPRTGENIFKRRDGRWEARYIHHYEAGKAKYRYLYGATYSEVKAKKLSAQIDDQKTYSKVKSLAAFDEAAFLWLKDIKVTVKESTYTRYYRSIVKYLIPQFKGQPLSKIDQQYFSGVTERLLKSGGAGGKPLSAKTVSDIICVLKMIMKYAAENGYPCPPLNGLKYPQKEMKTIEILTEENRRNIERQLISSEDTTTLGVIFAMFTGVRIGELCGLKWGDFDFSQNFVTIRRTVERITDLSPDAKAKTKVIITEPKTAASCRKIPLPDFLAQYLSRNRRSPECYLLTGSSKNTEPHQFYVRYQKFLTKNGLEQYSFHALRHTFATVCVENGFDAKALAEILGHSNVTTTLAVYVHPTLQQKKTLMERLTPVSV
ncbi:MAG: tyrosine-type recombinase/integrase [Eubacteriales bacterium]|nr:tyrosine-type recombinase/integrase [Eubacteriales bacterium]